MKLKDLIKQLSDYSDPELEIFISHATSPIGTIWGVSSFHIGKMKYASIDNSECAVLIFDYDRISVIL